MADHGPDPNPTKENSRFKGSLKRGQDRSGEMKDRAESLRNVTPPQQMKRGGVVKRTDTYIVHKGERVISKGKRKQVDRMMRKGGNYKRHWSQVKTGRSKSRR